MTHDMTVLFSAFQIGDSNLQYIPRESVVLKLIGYPGAHLEHLRDLALQYPHTYPHPSTIIISAGINNGPKGRGRARVAANEMIDAYRYTFPHTQLYFQAIHKGLEGLQTIRAIAHTVERHRSTDIHTIPCIPDYRLDEKNRYHWVPDTALRIWHQWEQTILSHKQYNTHTHMQ